jgi:hypothetical protein
MDGRKHLGILSLLATFTHLVMSGYLWQPATAPELYTSDVQVFPILAGASTDEFGLMHDAGKFGAKRESSRIIF